MTAWPEGAKYCVHMFADGDGRPVAQGTRFSETLFVADAPYRPFRLRRVRGPLHIWTCGREWWWAKAHDRTMDCPPGWLAMTSTEIERARDRR